MIGSGGLIGLLVPFAYLGVIIGSLITFSSLYRKRKANEASLLAPWFGPNTARDVYLTLLHLGSEDEPETLTPEPLLKIALMRRATEAVRRLMKLRSSDAPLMAMVHKGTMGEELLQRYRIAIQEMEFELKEVLATANTYSERWGEAIFRCANEMVVNENIELVVDKFQADVAAEVAWWADLSAEKQGLTTAATATTFIKPATENIKSQKLTVTSSLSSPTIASPQLNSDTGSTQSGKKKRKTKNKTKTAELPDDGIFSQPQGIDGDENAI